ncbi:MAG: transcription antitermination factor NusB [Prevotella sp.]|nr:transcription antitermination factor NusB [Prevotella sp.]
MINREIIRIKTVQLTYAYYQNGNKNIESAEKELFFSLSKAYDLYNYLLALIVAVTKESRRHLEVAQAKATREGTEMPSQKFAYNKFALQLEENRMLNDFMEAQKKSWSTEPEFLRKLYLQITESQIYQDYMADPDDSYAADRELWRRIYRTLIQDNTALDAILEEQSLYWNDDKEIVDTFVLKTIKRFDEKSGSRQELLPEYDSEEDREYARKLFRATIMNADEYQSFMSEASRNWDFNRLAYMDVVIMQIAIAEMMTFPSIPVSVSINEFVDIAKLYSTPRSGGYINGMLDAIARHLIDSGRLLKRMDEPRAGKKKPATEENDGQK